MVETTLFETTDPRTARRGQWLVAIVLIAPLFLFSWGPIYQWAAYRSPEQWLGLELRLSRASWLPGPEVLFSDQPCPRCEQWKHEQCAKKTQKIVLDMSASSSPPARCRVFASPP